ncbi:hypothetical protein BGW38_004364 [Lunasporangiospora selenospora]|uniref:Uncharacterized protein n=1 Tax=Lunasporangiospora selenospora TaxID=979761 RepID=A0A9P6G3B9_9FUNG|nr:hypothetical protein BGW38_004364 [Lunasporangiospora selenospora]
MIAATCLASPVPLDPQEIASSDPTLVDPKLISKEGNNLSLEKREEPSVSVRTTIWLTGTTYYVSGINWTPRATVQTFVEGWDREPHTREWNRYTADQNGAFSFEHFEGYEPSEHGQLQLYTIDSVTGKRSGTSIRVP